MLHKILFHDKTTNNTTDMKKILIALLCMVIGLGAASARSNVSRDAKVLPAKAQTMLRTYFGKTAVNHIKIETKVLGEKEYDVILNNGTEIEFNHKGDWTSVDCGMSAVPSKLILPAIQKYVKANYPSAAIVQIDIDRNKYEVELNNGLDLEFSRDGRFLKVDD